MPPELELDTTKVGARNSAMDAERIQAIHDRTVELGALCPDKTMETMRLSDAKAVKMLGANRLGGYAVLWGSDSEKDLDGEWFDSQTAEMTSIFTAIGRLPYLYNHASDNTVKSSVVGIVDVMEIDEIGLWYEAQLDLANQYLSAVRNLVREKMLGTSSGTLPRARQVEKGGRIARWPIVELSATPTPADPRQILDRPVSELKAFFDAIGVQYPATVEQETETKSAEVDGLEAETAENAVPTDETKAEDETESTLLDAIGDFLTTMQATLQRIKQ